MSYGLLVRRWAAGTSFLSACLVLSGGCEDSTVGVTAIHYEVTVDMDVPSSVDWLKIQVADVDTGKVIENATRDVNLAEVTPPVSGLVYPGEMTNLEIEIQALGFKSGELVALDRKQVKFERGRIVEVSLRLTPLEENLGESEETRPDADTGAGGEEGFESSVDEEPAGMEEEAFVELEQEIIAPDAEGVEKGFDADADIDTDVDSDTDTDADTDADTDTADDPVAVLTFPDPAPAGVPIMLDGRNSFDPNGVFLVKYTFDFGDGTGEYSSGDATVTHTYYCPGDYKPALTVENAEGRTGSTEKDLHVSPPANDYDKDGLDDCAEVSDGTDWTAPGIFNGMRLEVFIHDGYSPCLNPTLIDLQELWDVYGENSSPETSVLVSKGWLKLKKTDKPIADTVPGLAASGLDQNLKEHFMLAYKGRIRYPAGATTMTITPKMDGDTTHWGMMVDGEWKIMDDGASDCIWMGHGGEYDIEGGTEHDILIVIASETGKYGWNVSFAFDTGGTLDQSLLRTR